MGVPFVCNGWVAADKRGGAPRAIGDRPGCACTCLVPPGSIARTGRPCVNPHKPPNYTGQYYYIAATYIIMSLHRHAGMIDKMEIN
jgi:hypothetical protein